MQKRTGEWPLGPLVAQNGILLGRQLGAPFGVGVDDMVLLRRPTRPELAGAFALAIAARPPPRAIRRVSIFASPVVAFGDSFPFRNAYTCKKGRGYRNESNFFARRPMADAPAAGS